MGRDKSHRWQRRHKRKRAALKTTLEYADYFALFFIFFIWFITLRAFFTFEITRPACVEMMVYPFPDAATVLPFESLFFITLSGLICWATLTVYRHVQNRLSIMNWVWHGIIFASLLVLCLMNNALTPDHAINAPDGVLETGQMTWTAADGGYEYHSEFTPFLPYGEYILTGEENYATQSSKCVWLDANLISDEPIIIENYKPPTLKDIISPETSEVTLRSLPPYPYISFSQAMKDGVLYGLNTGKIYKDLQMRQYYRPLSAQERKLFLEKQSCLEDAQRKWEKNPGCRVEFIINWDLVPEFQN